MATKAEFGKVWSILCLAYPSYVRDIPAATLENSVALYFRLLADIPAVVLETAALQHIATVRFFPSISELRTASAALMAPESGTALQAWGEVVAARRTWDRYALDGNMPLPAFSDPLTGQLVRAMGMIALQDSDNEAADRARFIEAYEQLSRRRRDECLLLPAARALRERVRQRGPAALPDGRERETRAQGNGETGSAGSGGAWSIGSMQRPGAAQYTRREEES